MSLVYLTFSPLRLLRLKCSHMNTHFDRYVLLILPWFHFSQIQRLSAFNFGDVLRPALLSTTWAACPDALWAPEDRPRACYCSILSAFTSGFCPVIRASCMLPHSGACVFPTNDSSTPAAEFSRALAVCQILLHIVRLCYRMYVGPGVLWFPSWLNILGNFLLIPGSSSSLKPFCLLWTWLRRLSFGRCLGYVLVYPLRCTLKGSFYPSLQKNVLWECLCLFGPFRPFHLYTHNLYNCWSYCFSLCFLFVSLIACLCFYCNYIFIINQIVLWRRFPHFHAC